eukprot:sb/3469224/
MKRRHGTLGIRQCLITVYIQGVPYILSVGWRAAWYIGHPPVFDHGLYTGCPIYSECRLASCHAKTVIAWYIGHPPVFDHGLYTGCPIYSECRLASCHAKTVIAWYIGHPPVFDHGLYTGCPIYSECRLASCHAKTVIAWYIGHPPVFDHGLYTGCPIYSECRLASCHAKTVILLSYRSFSKKGMPVKPNYTYRCPKCEKMWFSNSKWATKLECTKCKIFVDPKKYNQETDVIVAT